MFRAVALVACLPVLAGCLSNSPDAPATPTPTFTATAAPATPAGPALTDTMHLLNRTHVTGLAPTGGDVIRVPVDATGIPVTTAPSADARWSMPRPPALTYLAGTATLWIQVEGTVTNSDPGDACFWRASLYAPSPSSGTGVVSTTSRFVCASEPAVVPPGVRELRLDFPGFDVPDGAEETLLLRIVADNGIAAPGATINVLTGTPQYDSQVTVYGLQLPLTTQTLLV